MSDRATNLKIILESVHTIRRMMMSLRHEGGDDAIQNAPLITPAQMEALRVVLEKKQTSLKEVAAGLKITSSAATQLVDGLVNNGFIDRTYDPDDRRALILSLAEGSQKKLKAIRAKALKRFSTIFEALSDAELAQYAKLNQKVAQSISKEKANL